MTKSCGVCGRTLPSEEFYRHPQTKDGLMDKCKACHKTRIKRNKAVRAEDPQWLSRKAAADREYQRNKRVVGHRPRSNPDVKTTWKARNPEKRQAQVTLNNAVRDGRLLKPDSCSIPGCESGKKIQAHHHDYTRPLDVTWLCTACHGELHRRY